MRLVSSAGVASCGGSTPSAISSTMRSPVRASASRTTSWPSAPNRSSTAFSASIRPTAIICPHTNVAAGSYWGFASAFARYPSTASANGHFSGNRSRRPPHGSCSAPLSRASPWGLTGVPVHAISVMAILPSVLQRHRYVFAKLGQFPFPVRRRDERRHHELAGALFDERLEALLQLAVPAERHHVSGIDAGPARRERLDDRAWIDRRAF